MCGGTLGGSAHCESDVVRVDNFVPTNDITYLLEQKPSASTTRAMVKGQNCVSVRHLRDGEPDCLKSFRGKTGDWNFTPITFLISVSTDTKVTSVPKSEYSKSSSCVQLEVMPEFMCRYMMNPTEMKEDQTYKMNQKAPKYTLDLNHPPSSSPPEELIMRKWATVNLEDVEENKNFQACFICIASKRKVVLMSLAERFVWMVPSLKPLQCDMCKQQLEVAVEVGYYSYLRQITAKEVNGYFCTVRDQPEKGYRSRGYMSLKKKKLYLI